MHTSSKSILAVISLLLIVNGINFTFHALGYTTLYSMYDAEKYASTLLSEGRSANDCMKIHTFFPTYPPLYEFRWGCVRKYAELAQDPSACQLLMPSDYEIMCIGAAESQHLPSLGCHIDSYQLPYQITCIADAFTGKTRTYTAQNVENCSMFEKENNKYALHWCYAKRAEQFGDIDACIKHADSEDFRNDCYYKRASYVEDLNLDFCKKIENSILRSGCTETVKAWIKYPELRPTL